MRLRRTWLTVLTVSVLLVPAPARAADFSPGAPGAGDPYFPLQGNGGYDVTRYDLDLRYDPAHQDLTATATIAAVATQDLGRFDLDLSGLVVDTVSVDAGPARFTRDGDELVVTPGSGLRDRHPFTVVVRYHGQPDLIIDPDKSRDGWIRTDDGVFNANEPLGAKSWFPGNHHPTDKAAFRYRIAVPTGVTAVANGALVRSSDAGGWNVSEWDSPEPMATYLATVTIGRFAIERGVTAGGVPILNAVDPREATAAAAVLPKIGSIVDYYASLFGPYPFGTTGVIIDKADRVGYALETQSRPLFPATPSELTLAHELAHQWYGDSVSLGRWRDMWLNEGFATYAEWLWSEHNGARTTQQFFDELYARPASDPFWSLPPADPGDPAHLFTGAVYARGAMTLHILRRTVGDTVFFDILRAWATDHRYGSVTTPDFVALAGQRAGRPLDELFHDWLDTPSKPGA
ncbi:M1 family metallopeptidase [Longispora sp. K20-0274]|uniref:M1 family metallopeptidase n=1 Tax=Longispora sp. K20-0274 TaxID=3088255 RepID=UPI0039998E45